MRTITKHIIHCSDSDKGDVSTIREWHKEKGWQDVGYHFVIRKDGEIECGRMLNKVGAHCKGYNRESIGTCLIGKDSFTKDQFNALQRIDKMLKSLFPKIRSYGHRDFNPYKTCPNFYVEDILK